MVIDKIYLWVEKEDKEQEYLCKVKTRVTKNYNSILIDFDKENQMFMFQIGDESVLLEWGEFRELTETIGQFLQDVAKRYLRKQKI